jgi:hypothetical protein
LKRQCPLALILAIIETAARDKLTAALWAALHIATRVVKAASRNAAVVAAVIRPNISVEIDWFIRDALQNLAVWVFDAINAAGHSGSVFHFKPAFRANSHHFTPSRNSRSNSAAICSASQAMY